MSLFFVFFPLLVWLGLLGVLDGPLSALPDGAYLMELVTSDTNFWTTYSGATLIAFAAALFSMILFRTAGLRIPKITWVIFIFICLLFLSFPFAGIGVAYSHDA